MPTPANIDPGASPTLPVDGETNTGTFMQWIKMCFGAEGTRNLVSASNPLPVTVSAFTARTASAGSTVSIGTTSATLIAANSGRKGLVITNTHASNTLTIDLSGGTAVALRGIVLYPRDSFVMDEFTLVTNAITAIASAASTTVALQELA